MLRFIAFSIGLFALLTIQAASPRSAELIMYESESCEWCEQWNEQIGPIYPKTAEGRFAPLRRVDIADDPPQDLSAVKGIHFTPTFVLMEKGREVGRILGYPGEDFFWGLLEEILKKAGYRQSEKAMNN